MMYYCTSSESVLEWKNTKKEKFNTRKHLRFLWGHFFCFVFTHIKFYSQLNAMEKNNQKKKQPACLCFQAIFVCTETSYCQTKSKQPWLLVNVLHNSWLEVLWMRGLPYNELYHSVTHSWCHLERERGQLCWHWHDLVCKNVDKPHR